MGQQDNYSVIGKNWIFNQRIADYLKIIIMTKQNRKYGSFKITESAN